MENQRKKLRLEDIKVESFVTSTIINNDTVRGLGSIGGAVSCVGNLVCMSWPSACASCDNNDENGMCFISQPVGGAMCCSDACTGGGGDVVDTADYTPLQSIMGPSCQFGVCPGGRTTPHPDPNVYCS